MENNDLKIIYEQLKDKYDLLLTNTFALDEAWPFDIPVLCGKSVLGSFQLYVDDDFQDNYYEYIFCVKYATPKKRSWLFPKEDYTGTHWHLETKEQALNDVISFMDGTLKL